MNDIQKTRGVATIPIVLILGVLALAIALGVATLSYNDSTISQSSNQSSRALFYAEAGARDALTKIARDKTYTCASADCYLVDFISNGCTNNTDCAKVTVSSGAGTTGDPKIITSKGIMKSSTRTMQVSVTLDSGTGDPTLQYGAITNTEWTELTTNAGLPTAGWGYRKEITIDYTKVFSTNQLYFPVLIDRTDTDLKDVAENGHVAQADGGDIMFYSSDGVTKLNHEIEKYDPVTGELVAWVKIPILSSSVNTSIYMYYGNASAGNQWNVAGTWNDGGNGYYKGVWHLSDPTDPTDSTTNANDGTNYGVGTITGLIDGAGSFNGTSDYISVPNSLAFDFEKNNFTISFWVYPLSLSAYRGYVSGGTVSPQVGYSIYSNGNGIVKLSVDGDNSQLVTSGTVALTPNDWNYVTVVRTGNGASGLNVYINSTAGDSPTSGNVNVNTAGSGLVFGKYYVDDPSHFLSGTLDEVHLSSVARSAGWISTEYANQSSPSTFYSVGTEEAL